MAGRDTGSDSNRDGRLEKGWNPNIPPVGGIGIGKEVKMRDRRGDLRSEGGGEEGRVWGGGGRPAVNCSYVVRMLIQPPPHAAPTTTIPLMNVSRS